MQANELSQGIEPSLLPSAPSYSLSVVKVYTESSSQFEALFKCRKYVP